ncbi:hypothetical protein [Roseateles amylovorans]|uniref:Leucine-rich repeat domain-containing protein n=1 Tax=Roseateles amylovorans TaxID=2978473 RepID=A0ABY6B7U3_9BURK|nr:hypothetical protein [Roseateles amylovorans]UXH79281.1 hypothetical protein N4261_04920 [Roseateles amylovorans]
MPPVSQWQYCAGMLARKTEALSAGLVQYLGLGDRRALIEVLRSPAACWMPESGQAQRRFWIARLSSSAAAGEGCATVEDCDVQVLKQLLDDVLMTACVRLPDGSLKLKSAEELELTRRLWAWAAMAKPGRDAQIREVHHRVLLAQHGGVADEITLSDRGPGGEPGRLELPPCDLLNAVMRYTTRVRLQLDDELVLTGALAESLSVLPVRVLDLRHPGLLPPLAAMQQLTLREIDLSRADSPWPDGPGVDLRELLAQCPQLMEVRLHPDVQEGLLGLDWLPGIHRGRGDYSLFRHATRTDVLGELDRMNSAWARALTRTQVDFRHHKNLADMLPLLQIATRLAGLTNRAEDVANHLHRVLVGAADDPALLKTCVRLVMDGLQHGEPELTTLARMVVLVPAEVTPPRSLPFDLM